jgi:hypothetical protein
MDSAIKTAHCRLFRRSVKGRRFYLVSQMPIRIIYKENYPQIEVSTVAETVDTTECRLCAGKEVFVKLVSVFVYFLIDYRLRANNITPVFSSKQLMLQNIPIDVLVYA